MQHAWEAVEVKFGMPVATRQHEVNGLVNAGKLTRSESSGGLLDDACRSKNRRATASLKTDKIK
jgi:hypothetical protein